MESRRALFTGKLSLQQPCGLQIVIVTQRVVCTTSRLSTPAKEVCLTANAINKLSLPPTPVRTLNVDHSLHRADIVRTKTNVCLGYKNPFVDWDDHAYAFNEEPYMMAFVMDYKRKPRA